MVVRGERLRSRIEHLTFERIVCHRVST